MEDKIIQLLRDIKREQSEIQKEQRTSFNKLNERMDKLETRFEGLETRMDGLETRMDGLEEELKDFRKETSQNFAMIINENRALRNEVKEIMEKQENDYTHLDLKTDAIQSELLKLKRQ